jgi:hypothetical protein
MNHHSLLSKQTKADDSPAVIEKAMASKVGPASSSSPLGGTEKGVCPPGFTPHEDDGDDEGDSDEDIERATAMPKNKRRSKKAEEVPMSFPQKVRCNERTPSRQCTSARTSSVLVCAAPRLVLTHCLFDTRA